MENSQKNLQQPYVIDLIVFHNRASHTRRTI